MNLVNHTPNTIACPVANGSPDMKPSSESSLLSFIGKKKINRRYLWITLIGGIIQLVILKLLFPFPDFISDSYNYIESAAFHLNVNLWPIGYAKFLWLVHQIHYSDTLLVCVQYIILESSLLYFFYVVIYFFNLSRLSTNTLFIFLLFNPLFLYLSNCVLSDAIFSAISLVWLAQLISNIYRPKPYHLIISAILIGLAFTIRYTAVYYPAVQLFAMLLSRQKVWEKVVGSLAPMVLIVPFVLFTREQTKSITGTAEFSVFGSWQIANNALYMYRHIDVDPKNLPPETVAFDKMVQEYYKKMPPEFFNFDDYPGTFFIKHQSAPLKEYMRRNYPKEYNADQFLAWGKVSPIYSKYGNYLITHYPFSFARYYMWLNVKNYFSPFLEKYGSYNVGQKDVWPMGQYWFHYKSKVMRVASSKFQSILFYVFPSVFLVLNFLFIVFFGILLLRNRLTKFNPFFTRSLLMITSLLFINFCFSVFATPVVLRYQVIPFALLFMLLVSLLEFSDQKEPHTDVAMVRSTLNPA